jgi:predicted DNA-binding protein with PD1-like motif
MEHRRQGSQILARLHTGDEIMGSIKDLARRESIPSGSLVGLGALSEVTLALYDLGARKYVSTRLEEEVELVSMTGNVSWFEGEPVIHAHAVVSRADLSTAGGHIMSGVVSATLELMVTVYPERVERVPDAAVGLNLLGLK